MLETKQLNRNTAAIPMLQRADSSLLHELKEQTQFTNIPAGHDILSIGISGLIALLRYLRSQPHLEGNH